MEQFLELNQGNGVAKRLSVKFSGGMRPSETITLMPGTKTREVLQHLGLDASYQMSDANDNAVFRPQDALYARVQDGDVLHVTSMVDAGL